MVDVINYEFDSPGNIRERLCLYSDYVKRNEEKKKEEEKKSKERREE